MKDSGKSDVRFMLYNNFLSIYQIHLLHFFHPDYTVGSGVPPNHSRNGLAGCTAGRDLHPALKFSSVFII